MDHELRPSTRSPPRCRSRGFVSIEGGTEARGGRSCPDGAQQIEQRRACVDDRVGAAVAELTRGFRMSSLGFVLLGALAVIVGALIPVQAATNAAMSRAVGSVAITSLALFAIGFLVVAAWTIILHEPLPSPETLRHVPAYGWLGG